MSNDPKMKFKEFNENINAANDADWDKWLEIKLAALSPDDTYGAQKVEATAKRQKQWLKASKFGPNDLSYLDGNFNDNEKLRLLEFGEKLDICLFIVIKSNERRDVFLPDGQIQVVDLLPKVLETGKYYLIHDVQWRLFLGENRHGIVTAWEIDFRYHNYDIDATMSSITGEKSDNYTDENLTVLMKDLTTFVIGTERVKDCLVVLTPEQIYSLRKTGKTIISPWKESVATSDVMVNKEEAQGLLSGSNKSVDATDVSSSENEHKKIISNYLKEIAKNGGRAQKANQLVVGLALHEILVHKRKFKKFKEFLESKHANFCCSYKGTKECFTIYLDGDTFYYSISKNNKVIDESMPLSTLQRRFTDANKMIKQMKSSKEK